MAINITWSVEDMIYGEEKIHRGHNLLQIKISAAVSEDDDTTISYGRLRYSGETWPLTWSATTNSFTTVNIENAKASYMTVDIYNNVGKIVATASYYFNYSNYYDVEVYCQSTNITTSGVWSVSYFGTYYAGTVAGSTNTLTLTYKYRQIGSTTWTTRTLSASNGDFSGTVRITGLDYESSYEIIFTATDSLSTDTASAMQMGKPMFDWSSDDFRFNIPVVHDSDIVLKNEVNVLQQNSSGTEQEVLSLRSDNNLYVGADSIPATYIRGRDINLLTDGSTTSGIYANQYNLLGLAIAMSNSYQLPVTIANRTIDGVDHSTVFAASDASCTAILRGNNLYIRYYCKFLNSQTSVGDIADKFIGKVTLTHNGKITDMDYMTAISGQSGTTCGLQMKNVSVDENTLVFEVYICNVATSPYQVVLTTFNVPVTLNLDAFTE